MSITPADLIRVAREQVGHQDEAYRRSGASRAYYAAFHLGIALQTRFKITNAGDNTRMGRHERLSWAMENFTSDVPDQGKRIRTLGGKLRQCHRLRIRADYYLTQAFSVQDAMQTLSEARQVEKLASELLK